MTSSISQKEAMAALQAYDDAIMRLTDKQLIDNPQLMSAVVKGRAAIAKAENREEGQ